MKTKIKLVLGYRADQQYSIDADEAHKAYYLFLHPEQRTVFSNGLAVIGKQIQSIEPDYNGTMGWNQTHRLDDDDWTEIRRSGVDVEIQAALSDAKRIAQVADKNKTVLALPLDKAKSSLKTLEIGI